MSYFAISKSDHEIGYIYEKKPVKKGNEAILEFRTRMELSDRAIYHVIWIRVFDYNTHTIFSECKIFHSLEEARERLKKVFRAYNPLKVENKLKIPRDCNFYDDGQDITNDKKGGYISIETVYIRGIMKF